MDLVSEIKNYVRYYYYYYYYYYGRPAAMLAGWPLLFVSLFSARQHICYSALYAIARPSVRPSVCLSVRHTGGSVKDG